MTDIQKKIYKKRRKMLKAWALQKRKKAMRLRQEIIRLELLNSIKTR